MLRISGSRALKEPELHALQDAAHRKILFHNGLWGAPMCFMWAGPDSGRGAGRVPIWEVEALDRLLMLGLLAVRPGAGATDVPVMPTDAGWALLDAPVLDQAA
jgi:hypothetical protein